MFELGKFYKHRNSLDVVFKVTFKSEDEENINLTGKWYNRWYQFIISVDNIKVKKEDIDKWKEFEYDNL